MSDWRSTVRYWNIQRWKEHKDAGIPTCHWDEVVMSFKAMQESWRVRDEIDRRFLALDREFPEPKWWQFWRWL